MPCRISISGKTLKKLKKLGLGLGLGPGKDVFTKPLRYSYRVFQGPCQPFEKGGQSFSLQNPAPNLGTAIVRLSSTFKKPLQMNILNQI